MNKDKLKSNIIIVCVIVAAFVAAMVIYYFNKDYKINFSANDYNESLSLTGDTTATLIWYTKGIYSKLSEKYNYYYSHDLLYVSEMEEDYLLNLVLYRLERLGKLDDGVVSEKLIKEQFKEIFGNNISYVKVNSINYKCGKFIYEKSYDGYDEPVYYFVDKSSSCDTSNNIISSTIASYKYDDRIEIYQAVGYTAKDGTYYDASLSTKVVDEVLDESTMLGNDHLFKRYKYIFNYDENTKSYYFYSVERHDGDV